jgi:hypothetical protein
MCKNVPYFRFPFQFLFSFGYHLPPFAPLDPAKSAFAATATALGSRFLDVFPLSRYTPFYLKFVESW